MFRNMKRFIVLVPAIALVALTLLSMPQYAQASSISQLIAWTKAYDQATQVGTAASFAVPNGSNRILVVGIATENNSSGTASDPSPITYGGVTLTKATDNATSSGRMQTWLYFLKDNAVMDSTSRPLHVTTGEPAGTFVRMAVWHTAYAGVNQGPSSYTTGNGFDNSNSSGPAQLSAAMAVKAGEQALYIPNIYDHEGTTIPVYTINANWTVGGNNIGTDATDSIAWKDEVAKRSTPNTNTTDNAATSSITPGSVFRFAMSAISLPPSNATAVTLSAMSVRSTDDGANWAMVSLSGLAMLVLGGAVFVVARKR